MATLQRRETLTGQLVRVIAERIGTGVYKLGDKLPSEQELIEEFGVSRTVVREAIANLKAGGMVTTQQGVGAFVVHQSPVLPFRIEEASLGLINEVVAVLELRVGIESEAATLAAMRRTDEQLVALEKAMTIMASAIEAGDDAIQADLEFHRVVAQATQNQHFLKLFNYLGVLLIPRAKLQTFKLHGTTRHDYLDRVNREHEQIFRAIEQRDPEAARAAMRLHLNGSRERLRAGMAADQPALA